jgi:uncharacterized protein (DUF2126 family)
MWGIRAGATMTYFRSTLNEAEGRRNARFVPGGHTPGTRATIPEAESNPYFPYTLDLRR